MLTSLPARRPLLAVLSALLSTVVLSTVALSGAAVGAHATEDPDGVGLTVGVVGSTPTPTPTASSAAPARATNRPVTPALVSTIRPVTQTTPTGRAATAALGGNPVTLAGVLAVSGLTAHAQQNVGPGGGDIVLGFTVKNLTDQPFDSTARFWVDNALGLQIHAVDDVALDDLAGGETRTVTVTLTDMGQWSAYNTHVTLTPPETVGETSLSPVTRDALLLVPPYFLLGVLALLGAISVVARYALLTRRFFPAGTAEPVS
ncbi:hypothetical protein [Cryobacterium arcticum]|uniref:Uncharacterized protein n=1 Tax=Cryobacterium arcticum TaxID=670052 RepID=A0A1B1BL42_9MICO|nr:hypothetical protein [Cryobacterium arcticum]ANP73330.1 hypothetical protein PA27867_2380 [Cryobacterium arcticum]